MTKLRYYLPETLGSRCPCCQNNFSCFSHLKKINVHVGNLTFPAIILNGQDVLLTGPCTQHAQVII